MSLERTSAQNSRIGYSTVFYGRVIDADEAHARLRAVTSDEVQRVAADSLLPGRMAMTIIGAIPESTPIGSWLE